MPTTTTTGTTESSLTKLPNVCVHCFTGTLDELRTYVSMGFYIGLTGWIADERRGENLRAIVRNIPLDKVMIETDGPFLSPHSAHFSQPMIQKQFRKRNEPCLLPFVAKTLAECMGVSVEAIARETTRNAMKFFGLNYSALNVITEQ